MNKPTLQKIWKGMVLAGVLCALSVGLRAFAPGALTAYAEDMMAISSSFFTNTLFLTTIDETKVQNEEGKLLSQRDITSMALDANPKLELAQYSQFMYASADGSPIDEANVVLQTKDGNLWAGNYNEGLTHYDGQYFRPVLDNKGRGAHEPVWAVRHAVRPADCGQNGHQPGQGYLRICVVRHE